MEKFSATLKPADAGTLLVIWKFADSEKFSAILPDAGKSRAILTDAAKPRMPPARALFSLSLTSFFITLPFH